MTEERDDWLMRTRPRVTSALTCIAFLSVLITGLIFLLRGQPGDALLVTFPGLLLVSGSTFLTYCLLAAIWWRAGLSTLLVAMAGLAVAWPLLRTLLAYGISLAFLEVRERIEARDDRMRAEAQAGRRRVSLNRDVTGTGWGPNTTVPWTISIFVSSTFRDFHAERDLIAGPVSERLGELGAEFGCRVAVIDLRWGVDTSGLDDDERHERVLEVCLGEIDRCRPYFLGFIGDRAGWQPSMQRLHEVMAEAGMEDPNAAMSITALEFEYGALRSPHARPIFFKRRIEGSVPPGWADGDRQSLTAIEERLPAERVRSYVARSDGSQLTDLGDLESTLIDELGTWVREQGQEQGHEAAIGTGTHATSEALFAHGHRVGYESVGGDLDHVLQLLEGGTSVCLYGRSGSGKSALWCAALDRWDAPKRSLAALAVGVSPESTRHDAVVRGLMAMLGYIAPQMPQLTRGERFILALLEWTRLAEAPDRIAGQELLGSWRDVLEASGPCLVAIDGVDRLDDSEERDRLEMLSGLPEQTAALISTSETRDAELLRARGFEVVETHPFEAEAAGRVVRTIAAASHRQLSTKVIDSLSARPRSPLWLRFAVAELTALRGDAFVEAERRGEDSPELLLRRVASELPGSEVDLVERCIHRTESRFGSQIALRFLALHAASRIGFAPAELRDMLGVSDLVIAGLRRSLAPLLSRSDADGRLRFGNKVVSAAVERYAAGSMADAHRLAVTHLDASKVRSESLHLELLHHALNCPDLGPEAMLGLFARFRVGFEVTAAAHRLVLDTIRTQHPDTDALDVLAAALALQASRQSRWTRCVRRVTAAFVHPSTGTDFVKGLIWEAFGQSAETEARLRELLYVAAPSEPDAKHGDPVDHALRVLTLHENGEHEAARELSDEILVRLRGKAEGTRYPGPVVELAEYCVLAAGMEEETREDPERARKQAQEALRVADHLPDEDPAHDSALVRLEALACIVRTTTDRSEREDSLARGEAIARQALDRWPEGERARQGIYGRRHSRFRATFQPLRALEADTLGRLRGLYLEAAGSILRGPTEQRARTPALRQGFLDVATDAIRDRIEREVVHDRLKLLDRVGDDAEGRRELGMADSCYELFLRDLRANAAPEAEAWAGYGLARRGAIAERGGDAADAHSHYEAACKALGAQDVGAAPSEVLLWCIRAAARIPNEGDDRIAAWVAQVSDIGSDGRERLTSIVDYLTDGARSEEDDFKAEHCAAALVAVRHALRLREPRSAEMTAQHAQALLAWAALAGRLDPGDRAEDALDALGVASTLYQAVARERPDDWTVFESISRTHTAAGRLHESRGRIREACEEFNRAVLWSRRRRRVLYDEVDGLAHLRRALSEATDAAIDANDWPSAMELGSELRDTLERECQLSPTNPDFRRQLQQATQKLSQLGR